MRLILATVCLFIVVPAVAGQARLPDTLSGQWETSIENCTSLAPTSGQQVWFSEDDGGVKLSQVNHQTEGGTCWITTLSNVGTDYILTGDCGMEEGEVRKATHVLITIVDETTAVIQSDWMDDGDETFHRCTPLVVYNNTPMDIGMGN